MKSNAPWSVKGIEKDAREAAKEKARREGMTVGEWLSHVIVTAGDPDAPHGEIEGLKLTDLVTAIEHLNRRIGASESRSLGAFDELARNFGGVVDRIQRLERIRPGAIDAPADIEERLARIEEKTGDRQKIDALKALEKAIGQVALQFDAGQKAQTHRLESTERQLQELAARIDSAIDGGSSAGAIDYLKDTIDGLAARIARAERLAADASRSRPAPAAADGEFAERTAVQLRVLGEEMKRGGDQIRAFESTIRKLSDQIDAAERRSSEGVQKVSETIAELRVQLSQTDVPDFRQEVETAVADLGQRTEQRLHGLQRSFDAIADRLDVAAGHATDRVQSAGQVDLESEIEDAFEEADAETDEVAFDFEDEVLAGPAPAQAKTSAEREPEQSEEIDGIDAILAELDAFSEPQAGAVESPPPIEQTDPDALFDESQSSEDSGALTVPAGKADFLAEARRSAKMAAAKEAAEQAAAASGLPQRRKLTPKQRAILAAKIRRKRLAEQGRTESEETPAAAVAEPAAPAINPAIADHKTQDKPYSLFAGLTSKLAALRPNADAKENQDNHDGKLEENPNLAKSAVSALKTKPVTLALGAAVVLATVALFLLVKDLVFGGAPKEAKSATRVAPALPAAPQLKEQIVPAPPAPLTQPRSLYLDAVAKLRSARTEADTRAALSSLEQAAALGHPPAQLQLGELYKLGQGVSQDLAQARAWYERSANGGNVNAMHRMGVMCARGQGGPADQSAAVAWFEKAANLGLVDSQYNLGAIYQGSEGASSADQDTGKAYYWYSLAAKNGDEQASSLATALANALPPTQRTQIDASVAAFSAAAPDPDANEIAPAS